MRRAVPVITATVGGLALLAGFHTSPGTTIAVARGPAITLPAPTPSPAAAPASRPPAGASPARPVTNPAAAPPSTPRTTVAAPATRTINGPVVTTQFGDVQVSIRVAGNRIVDVQALQLPSDRARSQRISAYAGPSLRIEALRAQSANIDLVSGASYTTDGYIESLQGALDAARL